MAFLPSLRGLLGRPNLATAATTTTTMASTSSSSSVSALAAATSTTLRSLLPTTRAFTTSPATMAKKSDRKKKKAKSQPGAEHRPRVRLLRGNMHGFAPPPLRMARNRHLRHWTIHRAWQLHQRNLREAKERELMRMEQGMSNACEELRKTEGPGLNGEGYLYRVAVEKKGMYGLNAVPIEYARLQTETPARVAWNHDWKR